MDEQSGKQIDQSKPASPQRNGGSNDGFPVLPSGHLTAVEADVLNRTNFSVGKFGMQIALTYVISTF